MLSNQMLTTGATGANIVILQLSHLFPKLTELICRYLLSI